MAEPGDPDYRYSINKYPTNGTQTNFNLSFAGGYISQEYIQVSFESATGVVTEPTFTFLSTSIIQVTPALPADGVITISRETPVDAPLVDFNDGANINEVSLDLTAKQAIFVAAETRDRFFEMEDRSEEAIETATAALNEASAASASAATANATATAAAETAGNATLAANTATSTANAVRDEFDDLREEVEEIAGGDFSNFAKTNAAQTFSGLQSFGAGISITGAGTLNGSQIIVQGDTINAATLAGQSASYYTNIVDRLGYTPADLAGATFTGTVTSPTFQLPLSNAAFYVAGPNPALSMDANDFMTYDRLNDAWRWYVSGNQRALLTSGYFLVTNGTGSATLTAGGDLQVNRGDGTGLIEFGNPGNGKYLHYSAGFFYFNGGGLYVNGSQALTTASSVNASTLQGLNPAQVAASGFTNGENGNGTWRRAPDGYTIARGIRFATPADGSAVYNFPIVLNGYITLTVSKAFPSPGASSGNAVWGQVIDGAGFRLGTDDAAGNCYWEAHGYT